MDRLKDVNDTIWKYIFELESITRLTDNMGLIILIVCCFLGTALAVFRKIVLKKEYMLGVTEYIIAISGGYAATRLPVIHERMNKALQMTADIIQQSTNYTDSFIAISGITDINSRNIAQYLYFHSDTREIWNNANPYQLYAHFYSTFDKIRCLGKMGDILDCPYQYPNAILWVVSIMLCGYILSAAIQIARKKKRHLYALIVIFQVAAAFYIFQWNYATVIFIGGFVAVEYIILGFLSNVTKSPKK